MPNLAKTHYEFGLECLAAQQWRDALDWFKRAAENKHPDAYFQIGRLYENGNGGLRDLELAVGNYSEAALVVGPGAKYPSERGRRYDNQVARRRGLILIVR